METKTPAKPKQPAGGWKKRLVFSAVVSAALTFTLCLFGPLVMGVKAHGHWIIYGKNQSIFPAFYGHFSEELDITVSVRDSKSMLIPSRLY